MTLNEQDQVLYRLLPDMVSLHATVLSVDAEMLALQIDEDAPEKIPAGSHIVITGNGSDVDYFAEVISRSGNVLRAQQKWTGRRSFFRVDDFLPLSYRKVAEQNQVMQNRVFPWYSSNSAEIEIPEKSTDPYVWRLLVEINTKLQTIMDTLGGGQLSPTSACKPVNISVSGIRFSTVEPYEIGDLVEIKILLPLKPPQGIIAYGKVVRIEKLKNGEYGIAMHFLDLDPEVQDVIIQYTLKRQRDIMKKKTVRETAR